MGEPKSDATRAGASNLRHAIAAAGDRVMEMVDSAERAAEEIHAEAEAEAALYLRERKQAADRVWEERARELAELTKGLPARAERLWREVSGLAAELEHVNAHVRALHDAREGDPAAPPPADAAVTLGDWTGAKPEPGSSPQRVPEEAVLRATQMAVAGTERNEIQRALTSEFGLADPASVTDEILGKTETG